MRLKQCIFALVAMLLCAFSATAQGGSVAKIGDTEYTTFADAMAAANAATGNVDVEVYGAVEFVDGMELNGLYTAITFTGKNEEAKITINQTAGGDYLTAHGKTVAFNDLILAKANPAWSGNSGHMGNYFSIQGGTVTYTGCTFPNGACTSGGTATYDNCTFQNASEYGLWVYDDALVTVNGGTIDSKKGIKVYSEGEESVTSTLTVKNATFTENVTAKPAVAVGYAQSITLIGNTYNNTTAHVELDSGSDADCEGITFVAEDSEGNDIASTLEMTDRSNSSAPCGVLVDGKIYTTVTTAAAEATSGSTVTLLYNTTETVELPEGVTLDTNGFTAENVTVVTSGVAQVGDTTYATLAEAVAAAQAGDEIVLLDDVAEDATLPAGVKFNGNGKAVGNLTAGGEITFTGVTKATSFGVQYTNTTVNIVAGACLEITGTGRMVIGHGCTFNITGSIEDAKTADVAALTPSLIMPGASFTGAGVTFNVTNAYISAPSSYCSSSSSASGTFDFNFTNSIWESAGKLAFESQSTAATVNFDLVESVLNTGSHLVFGVSRGEVVIDNSNVNVGTSRQIENQSTMTIKNGAVVNGAVATSSNAKNPGTIIVENATYAVTGEFSGSDLGTGTLIVKKGATVSAGSITKANIQIDATGMAAGDEINLTANLSNLAGTIEVINNNNLDASIVDGKIVLAVKPVAMIGETAYATLEEAFAAAAEGETITLLADATPALTSQRAITKAAVIDLGGNTLTLTEDDLYFGTTTFKNGTIVVDPSVKPSTAVFWMFANQTLTFDAVKVVATGVTGTYLIGLDGNNSDLNLLNGSEILIENTTALDLDVICVNASTGNDIVVENSKVNVTNLDGRVFFRGNYTVKDSEVSLAGITKAGFRIEAGQTLSIEGTSIVTVEGEPRDGGIHITDATATYTKAETATVNATVNAPAPAYVAKIGEQGYATLSAAFAAVTDDAQTVVLLQDVTEELTGAYLRGNITAENGAKVTINLTNSDWVYCPYTFVLGENITLNVPALFYYAGGAQINGAVITDAYYQRNAGTKLTINEPGSLTVTSEMFYIRYTDNDANAGIYVNGDNNDETVGLNLSVAYFYQGMIYAKDANIKTSVYWQTNETDGQGSANLVLDNSTLNVTVNEHNFKATGNSTVTLTNGSSIVIAGAFETGSNTEVSVDATSSIIDKNGKVKFGLSGEGTEANPFLISSVDDLVLFRNSVNAGETKYSAPGIYVALGADIDLAGENWIGIGSMTADHGFMGNFDGKNFKIKNLTIDNPALDSDGYAYAGLFALTEGTDKNNQNFVKNLTIENVTINTTGQIASAAIAYAYYTVVDNVTVCGNIAINGGDYTAGVLAYTRRCVNASNIAIIGNENSYVKGAMVVGGVISDIQMNDGLIADYSNFSAEDVAVSGTDMVGGISGIIATQTLDGATVKNVTLNSNDGRVGIVAGCFGGTSTISNVASENVAGTTAIVGPTYKDSKAVEARIGDTYYATLQTAATAAKENETVTLIADVEATEALNINCALDLNGHSLTATVAPTALPEGYAALPNLDGKFVIGAQPTATVNNLGMTTVAAGDYSIWNGSFDQNTEDDGDMPLSFVMQFLADQDAEDMETSPYADWYGDFVITFTGLENGSFTADGCYLAGHYGSFGWVKVPVDGMTIEEGARYPVMLGVGLGQKYDYICSSVEDFKCALYLTPEILEANPNIQVKLELGVVDNSKGSDAAANALVNNENVYSVTEYTYEAEDFVVEEPVQTEYEFVDGEFDSYDNAEDVEGATVKYSGRNVSTTWTPLYVPFEIPAEMLLNNGYEVGYITGVREADKDNDGTIDDLAMEIIQIKNTSAILHANHPYFIRSTAGAQVLVIELTDVTLYKAEEKVYDSNTIYNKYDVKGNLSLRAGFTDADRGISGGIWEPFVDENETLKPFRFYLTISSRGNSPYYGVDASAVKSMSIVVRGEENEDGTTTIYEIYDESSENGMIFDLQGRRVLEPEKGGLYIVNGKKVLVK